MSRELLVFQGLRAEIEGGDGVAILRVSGDFRVCGSTEQQTAVAGLFDIALTEHPATLVLNLSELSRVDTCGISVFARGALKGYRAGAALRLVLPKGIAWEALRVTRIFDAWPKFSDENEAASVIA